MLQGHRAMQNAGQRVTFDQQLTPCDAHRTNLYWLQMGDRTHRMTVLQRKLAEDGCPTVELSLEIAHKVTLLPTKLTEDDSPTVELLEIAHRMTASQTQLTSVKTPAFRGWPPPQCVPAPTGLASRPGGGGGRCPSDAPACAHTRPGEFLLTIRAAQVKDLFNHHALSLPSPMVLRSKPSQVIRSSVTDVSL